jgi:formylglycine-generating enzyme required for sulfatase activity
MAVLFVSHSSKDDAPARGLETWLRTHRFTDIFVDHSNIDAGEKWAQALRDSVGACRVVVCLVTENWLASDECFGEFKAAWYMGKRVVPLFAVKNGDSKQRERLAKVQAEDQGLDVSSCRMPGGALDFSRDPEVERRLEASLRAAGALSSVGLDPEAFAIDRKLRPTPFPGLASFSDDDADAALFYGRNREIAEALEELRKMRVERDPRPLVILGASGAGKSSLLKAGIIPRLRRETPGWLPLRAFRPGADPLLNFADALARTRADFGGFEAHGHVRDRLFAAWSRAERDQEGLTAAGRASLEVALHVEGQKLREAAARGAATILISVDQAEEVARAAGDSADALADYMRAALTSASPWQIAFTIRTDSFPELQGHRRFRNLEARGFDLRAVPTFLFDSVVEKPAKRYDVVVDDALVQALVKDTPNEDALPLLAFALQRLWRQFAKSGALNKTNYDDVGGLRSLIEDAAERALRSFRPGDDLPLDSRPLTKRQIDLAESTFVPALAQINDQGAAIRWVASWSDFDEEQQELLTRFDEWRLVVRKGEAGTVEVAHEALFREWPRLKSWLEPQRTRLEGLRSLRVDASNWDRNGRDAVFLSHRGSRLAVADGLRAIEAFRKRLAGVEFDYLTACRQAEAAARDWRWRVQALVYALLVSIIAGLFGWINQDFLGAQWRWWFSGRPYAVANIWPFVLAERAERALRPGESFRECAVDCPEMVVIAAGEFTMGSPATESGREKDEGPQHHITITKPFAVAKYLVTFDDWDACVSVGACPAASPSGFGRGASPVINVDWDEANAYAAWLSRMTGRSYRLLSETEWEYVARALSTSRFFFGDEEKSLDHYAWYAGDSELRTHLVGGKAPNGFGLYDVVGDVWEWVQDCYVDSYDGAPSDGSARTTACEGDKRAARGGAFLNDASNLRSARRGWYASDRRTQALGFRLARALDQ